jgi:hypothetical protein
MVSIGRAKPELLGATDLLDGPQGASCTRAISPEHGGGSTAFAALLSCISSAPGDVPVRGVAG